jgi:hypothetical protein
MLLQGLDRAKNVKAEKCLSRKISRRAKKRFTLSRFLAHPFFSIADTEYHLNGELNLGRPLEARLLASSYRRDRNLKPH